MGPDERDLLLAAFDSNWIAPVGPDLNAFEAEFSGHVDGLATVALSSGSAALHLALVVLGVGPGNDVLVSDFTFAATANVVAYVGARPVLIDSERETWNMDPQLLEAELSERAKRSALPAAVICVDLYGQCADYDALLPICARYDVPLIEDAAEALGADYRGRAAGTFGAAAAFSFNGNKIITTSGGGMLASVDTALVDRVRYLSTQARQPVPHYEHVDIGFNYRLSNLLAALGRGQLRVIDERVERRRTVNDAYRAGLGDLPGVSFGPRDVAGKSNCWLTTLVLTPDAGVSPNTICEALEGDDIECRPLWKPMHLQPVFAGAPSRLSGVSAEMFNRGLCLPSGTAMSDDDLAFVIDRVRACWL
jgi:dTDP-4-amino-4,6-dideoxygalactose transaminase